MHAAGKDIFYDGIALLPCLHEGMTSFQKSSLSSYGQVHGFLGEKFHVHLFMHLVQSQTCTKTMGSTALARNILMVHVDKFLMCHIVLWKGESFCAQLQNYDILEWPQF